MKRLLTGLLVLISLASYSQRFEGGALLGLNASQVDGDTYSGYHKPGVVFGAYVQTDLSRFVFTGMELKMAQKGSRNVDSLAVEGQIKYIMRLNYAELPVYLGIRTNDKISVILGLSPGFLISGNEINDYGKFPAEDRHPFNTFDLEAFLGFRFRITQRISIDIQGAYSLIPIRDQPGNPVSYWKSNQFNNLLNTTLLYRLDL